MLISMYWWTAHTDLSDCIAQKNAAICLISFLVKYLIINEHVPPYVESFVHNPPVFCSVATCVSLFGLYTRYIFCDILTGWSGLRDWQQEPSISWLGGWNQPGWNLAAQPLYTHMKTMQFTSPFRQLHWMVWSCHITQITTVHLTIQAAALNGLILPHHTDYHSSPHHSGSCTEWFDPATSHRLPQFTSPFRQLHWMVWSCHITQITTVHLTIQAAALNGLILPHHTDYHSSPHHSGSCTEWFGPAISHRLWG